MAAIPARPRARFVPFAPGAPRPPPRALETEERPRAADASSPPSSCWRERRFGQQQHLSVAERAAFSSSLSLSDAGQDLVSEPPPSQRPLEAELEKLEVDGQAAAAPAPLALPAGRPLTDSWLRPRPPAACITCPRAARPWGGGSAAGKAGARLATPVPEERGPLRSGRPGAFVFKGFVVCC